PALKGLGVGLQAEALLPEQIAHGVRADPMPLPGEFVSQFAGGLHRPAQRGHRIPAHVRSTSASSAGRSPESTSAAFLRPPPRRRTRPSGASPASNSSTPLRTVVSLLPAARATTRTPPCPRIRASAPINRRC